MFLGTAVRFKLVNLNYRLKNSVKIFKGGCGRGNGSKRGESLSGGW